MERLNALDAESLHLEHERWLMHIGVLCIFEGPTPSQEEIGRALLAKLARLPRYRKRAQFVPLELGRPVWVDDLHFDIDKHVRFTTLPSPGDDEALCELTGTAMSQALPPERPLWEIWIVDGLTGGRWAMISKVHHSMVDGVAAVDLHEILLDQQREQALPAAVPWTPERQPSGLSLVLDAWRGLWDDTRARAAQLLRDVRHPGAAARTLVTTATGLASMARKLVALRSGPIQGTIGPQRAYAHASAPLDDVQTIRRAFGGSINDVVLAAISGGYRALFVHLGERPEDARLRSLVPVSVRAPDEHGALDNRVSALYCDLPLHLSDPVERLRAVSTQMARLKASHMAEAGAWFVHLGDLAPPMVVGAITRFVARVMQRYPQRAVATVTTNVPGPREPLYFLGRRMVEWFPYVPIAPGVRVGTAILSYAGRVSFGVTTDRASVPDPSVLARAIAASLDELVAIARRQPVREARTPAPPRPDGAPPSPRPSP